MYVVKRYLIAIQPQKTPLMPGVVLTAGSYTWEKFGFLGACECEIALLLCLLCILKQQSEPLPSNKGKH